MAPPAKQVSGLMSNLFLYLKKDQETLDLAKAVASGVLKVKGEKSKTKYQFKK